MTGSRNGQGCARLYYRKSAFLAIYHVITPKYFICFYLCSLVHDFYHFCFSFRPINLIGNLHKMVEFSQSRYRCQDTYGEKRVRGDRHWRKILKNCKRNSYKLNIVNITITLRSLNHSSMLIYWTYKLVKPFLITKVSSIQMSCPTIHLIVLMILIKIDIGAIISTRNGIHWPGKG